MFAVVFKAFPGFSLLKNKKDIQWIDEGRRSLNL
jgi:hypothetical protein